MPQAFQNHTPQASEDYLQYLEHCLHDLCQPLTTLQCRLELGQICGDKDSLLEAVEGSLDDMATVFRAITTMRGCLEYQAVNDAEKDLTDTHGTD